MTFNACGMLYILRNRLPEGSKAWNKINDAIQALNNSAAKHSNKFNCAEPV